MIRIVIQGINPEPWATGTIQCFGRHGKMSPNPKVVTYQKAIQEEIREWMRTHSERVNLLWSQRLHIYYLRSTAEGGQDADVTNLNKATEDALQDVLTGNDRNNRMVTGEILEQHALVEFPGLIIEIEDYDFDPDQHERMLAELTPKRVTAFEGNTYQPPTEDFI